MDTTSQETVQSISKPDEAAEDLVGLTDPLERRRRQNRINQRAHRQRKRQADKNFPSKSKVASQPSTLVHSGGSSSEGNVSGCSSKQRSSSFLELRLIQILFNQLATAAYQTSPLGDPLSDHLLTLTKVNVFRAYGLNLKMIGLNLDDMTDDAISPFNVRSGPRELLFHESAEMPLSLRPTEIQRKIPHHPWLDFFPVPKMRDNLIEAGDSWDDCELCNDIMGFWNSPTAGIAGLKVWGEPWDIQNWELTEAFLKKWQWTVRGCPELMDSTNAWRAKRGENLILRYI
ncbi:hypothetical protein N7454_005414 [Penicillium verhagenii]|nr:hypothetical protein N7454_005414 [Penicillium verhagenii]